MLGIGSRSRGSLLGVVDVGTSKIVCLAVEISAPIRGACAQLECLGVGHVRSAGMRGGVVVDPPELEAAIRAAVAGAERNSRQRLEEVYVSVNCGRLSSRSFTAHADIAASSVTRADIARLHQGAVAYAERDGRSLVHLNQRGYRLDGAPCADDPRGMAARRLSADLNAVTADEGPVLNLIHALERSYLSVRGLVAAPYASGLAVTSLEERQLGVTVVDLGCGTTGFSVFAEGKLAHCEVIATGGHHLTFEIAKKFQVPLAEAERIKTLYASMVNASSDLNSRISYSIAAGSDVLVGDASRADLYDVVEPRVSDLLAGLQSRREAIGAQRLPVVLTGGGSQLLGLGAYAATAFGLDVRCARTRVLPGMPSGSDQPVFAGAVGLAHAAAEGTRIEASELRRGGYLAEVGRWLAGGL